MSYDLFFRPASAEQPASPEDFIRYFARRRHFTTKDGQSWYQNEDTGVYFSFELTPGEVDTAPSWVQFNLNYARPQSFVVEALPQVESFVSTFGLTVHDPQIDGMGDGPFDRDGFINGWVSGNKAACVVLAEGGHPRPLTMAAEQLSAIWQWNSGREGLQAQFGESVFVPQIMFVPGPLTARSAAVWSDAIPVLLPAVDVVFLYRDAYAPRRFFRRKPDVAVLEWKEVEPILRAYREEFGPVSYRRLEYDAPPPAISTLFTQAVASVPTGVLAADAVLETELVERIPKWQPAG
jgi:hypothetical protein